MYLKQILNKYQQSFQLRIFLALVLVIVIFIPGTGYVGYLQALKIAESQMEQNTITTARQISKRIRSFLDQQSGNVNLLASLIENNFLTTTSHDNLLKYFQLFKKDYPEYVNIYYRDELGGFIMAPAHLTEVEEAYIFQIPPWYKGGIEKKSTYWTGVYNIASSGNPGITLSTPVYDHKGVIRGVCGIDIDLVAFSRFINTDDMTTQGVAYIIDGKSERIISQSSLSPATEGAQLKLLHNSYNQLKKRNVRSGLTFFDNKQYVTSYTEHPGSDWIVGVTLPTSDYQQKVKIIEKTTLSLVIAAIILSLFLSYLLTKNIISPLNKLQQGIERIATGDLEHRVKIEDPAIAKELATSFNRMALSLKKSLIELKSTYAELQEKQKLAAVGKMTAGIAHEIKNPLGIILGSTQVILDQQRPWKMREKAAGFIMDEVVRLDKTLKAFLDFARPATPLFSEIDVVTLLEEILSATEERYLEEGYRIIRDFPKKSVPLIEADPGQVRQILLNIIFNSFKAMPEGGTITIRIRDEKEPEVLGENQRFISIRNPFTVARDWLIVSIKDEGCGMSEGQLEKISEPFVSFRDDGVGLGLSIVSQLVKLHRGHIQIETKEGVGTTFHLFFPCILKEHSVDVQSTDY